jgi:hypothetical protein
MATALIVDMWQSPSPSSESNAAESRNQWLYRRSTMSTVGPDDHAPIGAIFDTNSNGRFDLVIYPDGLLGIKGTYVGVALLGAGAGAGGAGIGQASGQSYERRRLAAKLDHPRDQLIKERPNFFIPRETIVDLVLRKRSYGHSLKVRTHTGDPGRTFAWKPKLNRFKEIERLLGAAFPGLVRRE